MAPKKTPISLAAKRQQRKRPGSIELVPPPKSDGWREAAEGAVAILCFFLVLATGFFVGYTTRGREVSKLKSDLTLYTDNYNTCMSLLQQKQAWKQQRGCLQSREWAQL